MEHHDFVSVEFDNPDTDQYHYLLTSIQLTREQATSDGNTSLSCSSDLQTQQWEPGGRLNKKDGLTRYGNSHVKDKTS